MIRKSLAVLSVSALLPLAAHAMPPQEMSEKQSPHCQEAQEKGAGHHHHADHKHQEMSKRGEGRKGSGQDMPPFLKGLKLDPEQRKEVSKLVAAEKRQHHKITHNYLEKLPEAERKAMAKELHASRDKTRSAIRELLTPEQQERMTEMEQRRQEWKEFKAWKAARKDSTESPAQP